MEAQIGNLVTYRCPQLNTLRPAVVTRTYPDSDDGMVDLVVFVSEHDTHAGWSRDEIRIGCAVRTAVPEGDSYKCWSWPDADVESPAQVASKVNELAAQLERTRGTMTSLADQMTTMESGFNRRMEELDAAIKSARKLLGAVEDSSVAPAPKRRRRREQP